MNITDVLNGKNLIVRKFADNELLYANAKTFIKKV
jgi:hypothetical protein